MDAIKLLEKYVSMPSGSFDIDDVTALAEEIGRDLEALGLSVTLHRDLGMGPVIEAEYGHGPQKIMLMGHMDTVFPRRDYVPFSIEGNLAHGSGVMDMKGGLVIMNQALSKALPSIDPERYTIKVLINPDEEIGSPTSHDLIYKNAADAAACLSFEPCRPGGGLVCERKGVTSFTLRCTGVRGHAGAAYLRCHSAIQELCQRITRIYSLRDDARDISINIGTISGGTAENVVADYAEAHGEFRYFDMAFKPELEQAITAICQEPGVEGCTTTVEFGAAHPAAKMTPGSQQLFDAACAIARELGGEVHHERTGGAGDIAIAAWAGAPVLDGLGMEGKGAHTQSECAFLDRVPFLIEMATRMILHVTR